MNATPPGIRRLLHVGCGPKNQAKTHPAFHDPGQWAETRLDIDPNAKPDIVASMTDMSMIAPAQFDAIFSSHNLEHLYPHDVPTALAEFRRVLKPTGFALIIVPDLQRVGELIAADKLEDPAYMSPSGPICPVDDAGPDSAKASPPAISSWHTGWDSRARRSRNTCCARASLRSGRSGTASICSRSAIAPSLKLDAAPQAPLRLREVLPVRLPPLQFPGRRFGGGPRAQLAADDLAGRGQRQLLDERDLARIFVRGEARLHMVAGFARQLRRTARSPSFSTT